MDHVKLELARPCLLNKSEYLKLAKANMGPSIIQIPKAVSKFFRMAR